MSTNSTKTKKKSLFDDIFRLQSTAPELADDIDPEDAEHGFTASLVEDVDEAEDVGATSLRRKAAIILDDPKYQGQKASRKDLYSDDEESDPESTHENGDFKSSDNSEQESSDLEDEADQESDAEDMNEEDISEDKDDVNDDQENIDVTVVQPSKSDDRKKGKAVHLQMGVWDQMIKSRISLQKVVSLCNQLPQPDTWDLFAEDTDFKKEANNAHSSVRKVLMQMLEVQKSLSSWEQTKKTDSPAGDSDEEITSESEDEEKDEKDSTEKSIGPQSLDREDSMERSDEEESDEEKGLNEEVLASKPRQKRKLDAGEMEEILSKHHKGFQSYRNDTLSRWDEKTRLTHGKIKSKNFAAFEMSVLKQLEQVLVNRDRLIRRIHQQRSSYRILGCPETQENDQGNDDVAIEDDEDIDVGIKQRSTQDIPLNEEIIDDNDFYHVCLRDLIEMKQNEEMDPITSNKQWLEIQRLRNKQKRKVDTKASKGRKIRYNIREKLKNYMTPYDKSTWEDDQKDDLFKALFGGKGSRDTEERAEVPTINIGL